MKKILYAFLVLYLFSFLLSPCLASELTETKDTDSHGVFAYYCYSTDPNDYTAVLINGKYTVTTDDKRTITVVPDVPNNKLMLVIRIIPETDKDAFEWFRDRTSKIGSDIIPLDIYYVDSSGNRTELTDSAKIEISLPDGYGKPVVCHLATNGKTTVINSSYSNGAVTFNTDNISYYVITSENADSPPTGDGYLNIMIILLTLLSVVILFVFIIQKRRNGSINDV